MTNARILIVYFSDSGNTKVAAEHLGQQLGATLERLAAPGLGRLGFSGAIKRVWTTLRSQPVKLATPHEDPDGYDAVILAGPVWTGRPASPLISYLKQMHGRLGTLGFVVTYGSSGGEATLNTLRQLARAPDAPAIALPEKDRKSGRQTERLNSFSADLRSLWLTQQPANVNTA